MSTYLLATRPRTLCRLPQSLIAVNVEETDEKPMPAEFGSRLIFGEAADAKFQSQVTQTVSTPAAHWPL